MKKISFCLILFLLLFSAVPLMAQPYLEYLVINEEITPSDTDMYLTVTGFFSDGTRQQIRDNLIWRTSDRSIATIDREGRLSFTGKGGVVTISVFKGPASGKKTVNIKPWPESIEIVTPFAYKENPYRLLVKGRFSDEDDDGEKEERYFAPNEGIIWSSSNPTVCWVNNDGIVTFTGKPGYVEITANLGKLSAKVNTSYKEDSDTDTWPIGIKIKDDITYNPEPQQLSLVYIMNDDSEEEIVPMSADWSSSNEKIATVSKDGIIKFSGDPGYTKIRVKYGSYEDEQFVTVGRFLQKLSINPSLNYTSDWDGIPLPLSATGYYNDGSEFIFDSGVKWEVDNKKVAEITEDGELTFTGTGGKVTIKVSDQGFTQDNVVEDTLTVIVSDHEKPNPVRLFIDNNPLTVNQPLSPNVYCAYDDGSLRDVTEHVLWQSFTPETASVYEGKIYLAPNPGAVRIGAYFLNLRDEITGYMEKQPGYAGRIYQIRIKENNVAFTYKPIKLTGLAVKGDGSLQDVTSQLNWYSSEPLVASIKKGVLNFTGRIGKTTIAASGYGLRDELQIDVQPWDLKPRVEKLVIVGSLGKGANHLKAIAHFNDGSQQDVTKEAVWNTNNKNRALVSDEGMVMFLQGLKPVTITANYLGKEAKILSVQ